ncbi:MAG: EAL domain-containing protein [Candidatus Thiodiazotropha sp. (ex Gloverina cf. vestifex)]|nr:EAL domain-containing protein [Candidatus Thiodiazotropha sp. (ex Gloverina cf. vestifex)]
MAAVRHGEAQWVTRIRSALEEDRFILYVQPIRGLNGKRKGLQHYEVLIRMIDESGGLIPPGAFIPAAERYDLMPAIDRWVVSHLIDRIIENGCCVGEQRRMFVNLSGQSLCDEQTLQTILDKIRQYDLPDGLLCFEVTETAAISNLSSAKHFMQTLKRFGCEFALDDFGSGLSSFGYLKHMPVEYLKIDGSFVKDMIDDRIDESMVDAINRIGHIMGLETIAECVENEEILGRLVGMGVDYAQGYGIRHPFPLDDMLKESA